MTQNTEKEKNTPVFLCDAMLGGLARWLRAAGYKTEFDVHFTDGEVVRRAYEEGKVLLTSDSGILDRYAVSEGLIDYVFVPRDLDIVEQLGHVMGEMDLPRKEPRCMECGGEQKEVELNEIRESVPEKVRQNCSRYWQCQRCDKIYWQGTHWDSINQRIERAVAIARDHHQQ